MQEVRLQDASLIRPPSVGIRHGPAVVSVRGQQEPAATGIVNKEVDNSKGQRRLDMCTKFGHPCFAAGPSPSAAPLPPACGTDGPFTGAVAGTHMGGAFADGSDPPLRAAQVRVADRRRAYPTTLEAINEWCARRPTNNTDECIRAPFVPWQPHHENPRPCMGLGNVIAPAVRYTCSPKKHR